MEQKFDWKNYILAFAITVGIFVTILFVSHYVSNQKISSIRDTQDSIAIDIMSSETEFSLLSELSCKNIGKSALSSELNSMAEKIAYSENNIGQSDDIIKLKKYYSLLEIKDFLLQQKITERCGKKVTSILYVYTTADNCSECTKQGYVLTALREKYPDLRVYSFDDTINLGALNALLGLYGVKETALPAIVINEETYTGFRSLQDIEKLIPDVVKAQLAKEKAAAKAAADSNDTN